MHVCAHTEPEAHAPPLRTHCDPDLVHEALSTASVGRERAEQPCFPSSPVGCCLWSEFSSFLWKNRKQKQSLLPWNDKGKDLCSAHTWAGKKGRVPGRCSPSQGAASTHTQVFRHSHVPLLGVAWKPLNPGSHRWWSLRAKPRKPRLSATSFPSSRQSLQPPPH